MKQKILLFILLTIGIIPLIQAQTAIAYEYDADGNRSVRRVALITDNAPAFKGDLNAVAGQDDIGNQSVVIYPNPTKGIFSIGVTGLDPKTENFFVLYNMSGQMLLHKRITADRTSVDITWDAAGMYLLDVSLGGKISRWKIVKQ